MEGLGNNQSTGNYITVFEGKFSQRVKPDVEGAKSRINKIGNTVYEKFYTDFTGKLIDIKVRDGGTYGKQWIFSFKAGGQIYNIQFPYSNNLASAFLKMLPNIDTSKLITLQPSRKEEDGKWKTSLFVKQNGELVKYAHTRKEPNGMPDMEQVQIKGQMVWDDSKQLFFLETMVNEKILPKLEGVGEVETKVENQEGSGLDNLADAMKATDEDEAF